VQVSRPESDWQEVGREPRTPEDLSPNLGRILPAPTAGELAAEEPKFLTAPPVREARYFVACGSEKTSVRFAEFR
jgi:hypothetical protein